MCQLQVQSLYSRISLTGIHEGDSKPIALSVSSTPLGLTRNVTIWFAMVVNSLQLAEQTPTPPRKAEASSIPSAIQNINRLYYELQTMSRMRLHLGRPGGAFCHGLTSRKQFLGHRVIRTLLVPNCRDNPPSAAVPEQLDTIYTPRYNRAGLRKSAFVSAENVSNVTEPFGFSVNLTFKESVLDQLGVETIDQLLVRHHLSCRMVRGIFVRGDKLHAGDVQSSVS